MGLLSWLGRFSLADDLLTKLEIGAAEIVAFVAVLLLLRSAWRNVPQWAKPDFIRRWEGEDLNALDGKNADINSPFELAGKLQEMMRIAKSRCDTATPANLTFRAFLGSFLAIIRLWQELRQNHPHFREEQYHDYEANRADGIPGRKVDADADDLANLYTLMEYSDWAYLEDYNELRRRLAGKSFDLVRQDLATQPGRVGHYVALDYTNKIVLVGIKGTSHISDIFTDLVAKALPHELSTPFDKNNKAKTTEIRVHEGIWIAASQLADDIEGLLRKLFVPAGYQVLLCGHSLGAGTSCLLGLLLRSRIPELQDKMSNGKNRLRVVAFATPAVLNFDACVACAPFCTSVVNNSDIVPRASVSNLVIMNQLMVEIQDKVKGKYSDHYYKIAKNFKAFYRNMTDLVKSDEETIMSPDEWDAFFDDTHRATLETNNLYVPGKVICLFERDGTGLDDPAKKEFGGVVADGGMKMLRQVELTPTMVSDHSCSSYFDTIMGFTSQTVGGGSSAGSKKDN